MMKGKGTGEGSKGKRECGGKGANERSELDRLSGAEYMPLPTMTPDARVNSVWGMVRPCSFFCLACPCPA